MFHVPEQCRVYDGPMKSDPSFGRNGVFRLPGGLLVIASDGLGWEHVSVSMENRCPTWEEMCKVKALFWDADDLVVQLHPPKGDYVNQHPFCLHLWRKAGTNDFCERPAAIMAGIPR